MNMEKYTSKRNLSYLVNQTRYENLFFNYINLMLENYLIRQTKLAIVACKILLFFSKQLS